MTVAMNQSMESDRDSDHVGVTRALISVSDKSGLTEFAMSLQRLGIEIFSTGGTARHLTEAGLNVTDIAEYTRFPEMMDGRVKTLHPKIFGGILSRRDHDLDRQSMADHGILAFDLVVVNLYPFAETVERDDCTREMAIENIDIGGPSLVRAAAKNCRFVAIATSPNQYESIEEQLNRTGGTNQSLRDQLMLQAFQHTAEYDAMITRHFADQRSIESEQPDRCPDSPLPQSIKLELVRKSILRYGENSHQQAGLYQMTGVPQSGETDLSNLRQLNGKELSFNNLLDVNNGMSMVASFQQPACVVIKHNNPCGAASVSRNRPASLANVFQRAFAGDPVSAFGSIVAANRKIDIETASFLADGDFFVEAIVCPGFDPDALEILTTRPKWKKNVRLLETPTPTPDSGRLDFRCVHGGMLVQQADDKLINDTDWKVVTEKEIDDELRSELAFAWNMVRFVKSNAIVLGHDHSLCGVGAGQMSRVDSVRIAIQKAGDRAGHSVLASDAFFPFPDSVEIAAKAGVRAIIQPGGSVKDDLVTQACNRLGVPMIFTGKRHFLH